VTVRLRTLRARITALAALAVFVVLSAVCAGLVLAQRATLTESLDEAVAAQADAVAARVRAGDDVTVGDLRSDDVEVEVVGSDGTVVAAVPGPAGTLPAPTGRPDARTVDVGGGLGRARLVERDAGPAAVLVAGSMEDVEESTAALVRALAVGVPLATAVLAGIIAWAVGRALRPVEDLRARVDLISEARLHERLPEPATPAEIGRLARTMNAMLDRLEGSAAQQRRFVADASHELRSPLTRIRAELEVDAAHPGSADPGATAASVLAETGTLQRLLDDLLLLARSDAGAAAARHEPVDLDAVVEEVVAGLPTPGRPEIDLRGVRPVQVLGVPGQLRRAVANLLDNAVRHARERVVVTVSRMPGDGAEVVVTDDGPGIPAGERERVFERFTRLDDARSAHDGGAGLGLAIARDVVTRHGGTLELDPAGGPGARLVLRLPASACVPDGRPG
jgi:signal transduction histidine kinase